MRYPTIATLAALAAAALIQPLCAQQVEPRIFTLENGMKFLLVPRTDQPNTISAGWVAKVGSVNERPGITGISHFFEHMMFKGTDTIGTRDSKRDAEYRAQQAALRSKINALTWGEQYRRFRAGEIDDAWDPKNDTPELAKLRAQLKELMDGQQGKAGEDEIRKLEADAAAITETTAAAQQHKTSIQDQVKRLKEQQTALKSIVKDEFDQIYTKAGATGMNAGTSHDLTFYYINIPSNKLELWAWMESDRLNNSVFREFFSERDVVHEERRLRTESTPTGVFQEQFDSMFWVSCGYSWPVIGWTSDLNSYTMEEAQKYWNVYYRPNNIVGIIVGDFNADEVEATVRRYFSRLEPGKELPPQVVTLESKQMAEMRMNAEADAQPQVEVRYHTVPFQHKDSYALEVMAGVLNGRTGRLYKDMVEGSEIASSAGTGQDSRKYAGYFAFEAETKGDATPADLESAWYEQLKKLQSEPVDAKELQKVKNQAAANAYRRLQRNLFLMIQLAVAEAAGDWSEINKESAKIQAVTAQDIQAVAKKYFDATNRSVATFTRKASALPTADPELAGMPPQMQAAARQMLQQLATQTNAEELKQALSVLQTQAENVPPDRKAFFDFMVKKLTERIQALEGSK